MWILPAVNAEATFHNCHLNQRVIAQFIALIAIKLTAKIAVETEVLAPQDKCTALM
jgi:hypothetical protein